jgi:hypothetical protein
MRFTANRNHIHDRSMTQWIVEKKTINADEHCKGVLLNTCRHIGHRQERTKRHLTCVVHDHVSEDTGSYFGGASVAADQDITHIRLPVREPRYEILGVLRESLKAVAEEQAILIVSTHSRSQCGVKVNSVNLMVSSTVSLDIVISWPDFHNLTRLKVPARICPGGISLFGDLFANA